MKKTIILLGSLGGFAVVALFSVMYGGLFNVATGWQDPAAMRWVLVNTRESSIMRRAKDIEAPSLNAVDRIEKGFRSYREMCVICHGTPEGKPTVIAKGLNPEPPDLSDSDELMSASELFWVIKNGIRMTGMPAWGPTHSDEELWDIVAFVKQLPQMSSDDYNALNSRLPVGHGDEGDTGHGH